ncbi:MAG: hypothetical protein E7414_06320 [Ruminococcaceae bacterium]|nr:hypothetical protein [Oscillospiraceae bacterium]
MRRLIQTVSVNEEPNEHTGFFLDYYVLQKEVTLEERTYSRFGLEICKRACRSDGTPYIEYRKIFDVFHTEGEAEQVLLQMARNTVTPISMKDILEDLLGTTDFQAEELFVEAV